MKTLTLILISLFSLNTFGGGGSGDIGSGGDLIRCSPTSENDLNGLYSLDYIVAPAKDYARIKTWQESMKRIRKILADKLPELTDSFSTFHDDIFNTELKRDHIWEPTPYALIELSDENLDLAVKIPDNCRNNKNVLLIQAVIRQSKSYSGTDTIVFKYMQKALDEVTDPLQLSFLFVHEWLWSLSDNVDRNRRINALLHSRTIEDMDEFDLRFTLERLGFVFPKSTRNRRAFKKVIDEIEFVPLKERYEIATRPVKLKEWKEGTELMLSMFSRLATGGLSRSSPQSAPNCEGNDCPVANISLEDAKDFSWLLSEGIGSYEYRLPTDAELENLAKRSESMGIWEWTDTLDTEEYPPSRNPLMIILNIDTLDRSSLRKKDTRSDLSFRLIRALK